MSARTDSNHKFLYAVIKHSVGSVSLHLPIYNPRTAVRDKEALGSSEVDDVQVGLVSRYKNYANYQQVDYKAVAKATNMTEGAARMRMSRLRKSLDTAVDKDAKADPKAAKSEDKEPSDSDALIPKKRRLLKRGKDFSKTESPADDYVSEDVEAN